MQIVLVKGFFLVAFYELNVEWKCIMQSSYVMEKNTNVFATRISVNCSGRKRYLLWHFHLFCI